MRQLRNFATLEHQSKKKRTKREVLLAQMDEVVPWALLLALIEPHYSKAGDGRRPYALHVPASEALIGITSSAHSADSKPGGRAFVSNPRRPHAEPVAKSIVSRA